MGKVSGVRTGVRLASHEKVVIADDDVRYDPAALRRVAQLLESHDLVRPQNYFSRLPWHARWDTARTLLNRCLGRDYPGTLAVRRSRLLAMGLYDGDVLFENLELIRTVRAHGGSTVAPLDLYVARVPPSAAHFWGQRTRQAYDDFALPAADGAVAGGRAAAGAGRVRRSQPTFATAGCGEDPIRSPGSSRWPSPPPSAAAVAPAAPPSSPPAHRCWRRSGSSSAASAPGSPSSSGCASAASATGTR